MRCTFVLTLFACFASFATAQDVAPAKPAEAAAYLSPGVNPRPKVDVAWNRYHDYAEATTILKNLAASHPEFCKLESLGRSYGGREMWVATITNFGAGPIDRRPAFWIDAGIHANEIQATEVALYTAWLLLESRGHSPTIDRLLDERVFYVLPMMSPDSRDAHFHEPNTTHSPRSGQRPIDDDKDGAVDEDPADDLDRDGHIAEMRVRDPNGRWKTHPEFPQLMIEVKPDEKGEWTLLGTEGIDNDDDGAINEDGPGSYDPNRDWGWGWQPRHIQGGAYRHPFSIEENRLVAEFIQSRPHIAGAQSYHNAGGMILRGPGVKSENFDAADVHVYDALGRTGERILPGYKYMVTSLELYEVRGGELDWLHQTQGVFAFTNELFTSFNFFREGGRGEGFWGSDEIQRQFDKWLLLGDGYVKWHEVDHPTYGKIEIGGPKKNWGRQPPSFLLEEECHRNAAFTLYHADQMPQVRVQSALKKDLGGGLIEVTAIVENVKLTPTHSSSDLARKITPPDEVELIGEGTTVLAALTADEPFFRTPAEQKREPKVVRLATLGGHSVRYVRWIVKPGPGGMKVELRSTKGGRAEREVE